LRKPPTGSGGGGQDGGSQDMINSIGDQLKDKNRKWVL